MRGLIDEKVFPVGARRGARRGRNNAYHRGPGTECRDEGGTGGEEKAACLAAIEAQAASLTDAEMLAAQLVIEYLGHDVVLTDAVEFSLDDFEGTPCHVLLLRNANDCYLAYSYDTETVYCPSSKEVWNYIGELNTEKDRFTYLLCAVANTSRVYVNNKETLTRVKVAQINSVLSPEESAADIMEEVNAAQDALLKAEQLTSAEVEAKAAQIAMERLEKDAVLTNMVELSTELFITDDVTDDLRGAVKPAAI